MTFILNTIQHINMDYTLNSFFMQCLSMSPPVPQTANVPVNSTPKPVGMCKKLFYFQNSYYLSLVIGLYNQGHKRKEIGASGETPAGKKNLTIKDLSVINRPFRQSLRLGRLRRQGTDNPYNQGATTGELDMSVEIEPTVIHEDDEVADAGEDERANGNNEAPLNAGGNEPAQVPPPAPDNVPGGNNDGNHEDDDNDDGERQQDPGGVRLDGSGDDDEHILVILTKCFYKFLSIVNRRWRQEEEERQSMSFDMFSQGYHEIFDARVMQKIKLALENLNRPDPELVPGPSQRFYGALSLIMHVTTASPEVWSDVKNVMMNASNIGLTEIMVNDLRSLMTASNAEISQQPFVLLQVLVSSGLLWMKILDRQDVVISNLNTAVSEARARIEQIPSVVGVNREVLNYIDTQLSSCKSSIEVARSQYTGLLHGLYMEELAHMSMNVNELAQYVYITSQLFTVKHYSIESLEQLNSFANSGQYFFFGSGQEVDFVLIPEVKNILDTLAAIQKSINIEINRLNIPEVTLSRATSSVSTQQTTALMSRSTSMRSPASYSNAPARQSAVTDVTASNRTGQSFGSRRNFGDNIGTSSSSNFPPGRGTNTGSFRFNFNPNTMELGPFRGDLPSLSSNGGSNGYSGGNGYQGNYIGQNVSAQIQSLRDQLMSVDEFVRNLPELSSLDPSDKVLVTSLVVQCDQNGDQCEEVRKSYLALVGKPGFSKAYMMHDNKSYELDKLANAFKVIVKTFRININEMKENHRKRLENSMKSLNKSLSSLKIVKIKHEYELLGYYDQLSRLLARNYNEQCEIDTDTLLVTITEAATTTLRSELVGVKSLSHAIQTVAKHITTGSMYLNALISHLSSSFKPRSTDKSQPQTSLVRSQLEHVGKVLGEFKMILRHRSLFVRMTTDHVQELFVIIFSGLNKLEQATAKRAAFMSQSVAQRQLFMENLKSRCNDNSMMNDLNVSLQLLSPELLYKGNNTSIIDTPDVTSREANGALGPTDFVYSPTETTPMEEFYYLVVIIETMRGHLQDSIPNLVIQDNLAKKAIKPSSGYQRYNNSLEDEEEEDEVEGISDGLNNVSIDEVTMNNRKIKGRNRIVSPLHQQQQKKVIDRKARYQKTGDYPCLLTTICSDKHARNAAWACPKFRAKPLAEKWNLVRELKLCFTCLRSHPNHPCPIQITCPKCSRRHNSLLCDQTSEDKNKVQINHVDQEEIDPDEQAIFEELYAEDDHTINNVDTSEVAEDEGQHMDSGTRDYLESIKGLLFELVGIVKAAKKEKSKSMTNECNESEPIFESLGKDFDELVTYCYTGLELIERNNVVKQGIEESRLVSAPDTTDTVQVIISNQNCRSIYHIPIVASHRLQTLVGMVTSYLMYCGVSDGYKIQIVDNANVDISMNIIQRNFCNFSKYAMCKDRLFNIPFHDVNFDVNKSVNKSQSFTQISPKSELFYKIFNISKRIHSTFPMRLLNIAIVRIILGQSAKVKYFQEQFKHLPDVHVETQDEYSVLLCPILLDSGACSTSGLRCLTKLLDCKVIGRVTYNENTPAGSRVRTDEKIIISLLDDAGRVVNVPTVSVDHLGKSQPVPEPVIDILCADLNIAKDQLYENIGILTRSVQPYFLFGNNIRQTRYTTINDFTTVNLERGSIFNPNLSLVYSELSINKYYLISGSFGIDGALLDVQQDSPILLIQGTITESIIDTVAAKITRILDISMIQKPILFLHYA